MYTITGATGHVGAAAADELLRRGAPVRAVVRDVRKGDAWAGRGAEVAVADFEDREALAQALAGSRGAFVLLPTVPTLDDAGHRRLADSIAGAVGDSGVPHVVLLSSVAADLADGTGPIRWLHHLEGRLRRTGVLLTAIRPCPFQEEVESVLDAAVGEGVYPVFGEGVDVATPRVATRDVGRAVAEALLGPPPAGEVVDLVGPASTEREVAAHLGDALGTPLRLVTIPRPQWVGALVDAGLPEPFAQEIAALHDAGHAGLFQPRGDRQRLCTTPIEDTIRRVVDDLQAPAT